MQLANAGDKDQIVVSPSRFSPLQIIDEEEEEEIEEETGKEIEEGEIQESKTEGKKKQSEAGTNRGNKQSSSAMKQTRGKAVRAKDLIFSGKQGTSKKTSVRKL